MRFLVSLSAVAIVVRAVNNCTAADYINLGAMNAATMTYCIGNSQDGLNGCLEHNNTAEMSTDCADQFNDNINEAYGTCDPYCQDADWFSITCKNCRGSVAIQEIVALAPAGPEACGNAADIEAIGNANFTSVLDCGRVAPYSASFCVALVGAASDACMTCLMDRLPPAAAACVDYCTQDSLGDTCLDCMNYGQMSAMAFCIEGSGVGEKMLGLSLFSIIAAFLVFYA